MKRSPQVAQRRRRLVAMCGSLPEVDASPLGTGIRHLAFRIRKRIFAYYLFDHHGDGRIALCCKAEHGEQKRLVGRAPRRFFVPPYVGPKGWVGVRLDLSKVDWNEVAYLVGMAYRLTAPRSLVARLEKGGSGK